MRRQWSNFIWNYITQNRERRATFCAEKNQLAILILCTLASESARGAGKRKEEKRRLFEANNSETAGYALLLLFIIQPVAQSARAFYAMRSVLCCYL